MQHVPGVDTTRFKIYIRSTWRDGIPTEELSVYRLFDKTNNAAESFSKQFNKFAVRSHLNFFQSIRCVAQVLHNAYLEYLRLGNGLQITRGPKRSLKHTDRS